ncbi:Na+/H+ antiporter NhaA [Azospirillum baldaniorum]|uniref:Na(+)/H(+) antiporter NhaA n=1 Tax=Azospirillum baldaniorum TaxID=1064539 RepID=A0A9P1NMZ9_9PROT|nr:Na+/H+ antiporter NhaA [Azospirillum baldaniorum]AWJ89046.1 Na+/H+ antiporter NhaA [Azospirillum baldaniorum]TWA80610.1 sodium/proton antiporter (NhaA family) [Azospirillum brasilense]CCC99194.1 Na(+)/H(+) antiporter nhaA [Azospirillum baldaniorum]
MDAHRQPAGRRPAAFIRNFMSNEASGGILLMVAAALALVVANSPLSAAYFDTLHTYILGLSIGHWINDGLMAIFFLLVGLEIKREMLDGQLSNWSCRILPGVAAAGGMLVPALVYLAFNAGNPATVNGWAIPAATDIAFALGVLSLLGPRVPVSLKIFLTALAIIDDLGAVIIIALFYTADLSLPALGVAALLLAALIGLNRFGVRSLLPYLVLGAGLWGAVLLSGVHATLAGVTLALTIPLRPASGAAADPHAPLLRLEHAIHPWVAFLIVPVFGFANAGVSFAGMDASILTGSLPLGIALGLFLGKMVGVFGTAWLTIRLGFAGMPAGATTAQLYGVALLCGIGFTMSLFIGALAFPTSPELGDAVKVGVFAGSILSATAGALVLRLVSAKDAAPALKAAGADRRA